MSKGKHVSETPATQFLKQHHVPFEGLTYDYVDHGGTHESSRQLGVPVHQVVKTLVMETEEAKPLIILMHGDCEVSTKNLARQAGCKRIQPCHPETAQRHSGYQVGGTSPFGIRKKMPIYIQKSILELPEILINGGRRGYLVKIQPDVLVSLLNATVVDVALLTE